MEKGSLKEKKGYLVVERHADGQAWILHADSAACELSGYTAEATWKRCVPPALSRR